MTNDDLTSLIGAYNSDSFPSFAAFRKLSHTVVLGYVWTVEVCNESGYKFYFVLDGSECIGIVQEGGISDLHWLVLEEHRKMGHLHRALHEYIFPHMFSDGRDEQFASANSKDGADYAIRQGFKLLPDPGPMGDMHLRLDSAQIDITKCPVGENQPLTNDEIKALKVRLRQAKALVRSVSEQILCHYGEDVLWMDELAHDIERTALDLTDINYHPKVKKV